MGRRKNYPWNSRTDKQMTNLVSGLLTGLIVAPFAAVDALSAVFIFHPSSFNIKH